MKVLIAVDGSAASLDAVALAGEADDPGTLRGADEAGLLARDFTFD